MRLLFESIGAIVTFIICLIIAIPVILTVVGVAVPALLIGLVLVLLLVLLALAILGLVALVTFWRVRHHDRYGRGVTWDFNGKRYHFDATANHANHRRDVTDDD